MISEESIGQRPLPVTVGLLGKRSIVGAVVVLSVALFYAAALPAINSSIKGEGGFVPGEPFVVGGTVQVTPAAGWELEGSNELFTTFTKSGATLVLIGAAENDASLQDQADLAIAGFEADTADTWVIGQPQTFTTNVGDHGISVTAHSTSTASESFVIRHDLVTTTAILSSPESVWVSVTGDVDTMINSIVFVEGGDA